MEQSEFQLHVKNTFNTVAEGYERDAMRFFNLAADKIPGMLGLEGHEHVLDVATGTGIAANVLASHLSDGRVTGVDFSEAMLAQAQQKFKDSNNVDLHLMDMQKMSFEDDLFDAANCSFGIFFVDEMEDLLGHIANKVKPGGRVSCCGFYETAFQPFVELFLARLKIYDIHPPEFRWKRIGTPESFAQFYGGSVLENIRVERFDIGYYLKDADVWWEVVWNAGFRGLLAELDEQQLAEFKEVHLAEVQAMANENGVYLNIEVLFAVGDKPSA